MKAHCNNCSEDMTIQIPKGVKVKQYEKEGKCPNCEVTGELSIRSGKENLLEEMIKRNNEKTPQIYPWYPQPPSPIPYKRWDGSNEFTCNENTREDLNVMDVYYLNIS